MSLHYLKMQMISAGVRQKPAMQCYSVIWNKGRSLISGIDIRFIASDVQMHKNKFLLKMGLQRNLEEKTLDPCPVTITIRILVYMKRPMRQKVLSINTYVQHVLQMGERVLHTRNLNVGIKMRKLIQKTNNQGYRAGCLCPCSKTFSTMLSY